MYDLKKKGSIYHKLVVDADTREMVCLCGEPKCDASGKVRRKFHNRSSEYGGVIYDSALEMRQAISLDWMLKAKAIHSWERQIRISFDICLECARIVSKTCSFHPNYRAQHLWTYICDFLVHHNNGDLEYQETKGMELPTFKMKWKMMEAVYGRREGVKLTLIKESPSRRYLTL